MIFLLSPSKTLANAPIFPKACQPASPEFLARSSELIAILRKFNPADIQDLMGVSQKLADLNYQRFQAFQTPFTPDNATPALTTFKGDVYAPMQVEAYTKSRWAYANRHVRILSGLYGLLRPLDLMQPYRLEMGTKLKNKQGKDLYDFWGEHISKALNAAPALASAPKNKAMIMNLASEEYFKAVNKTALKFPIIHMVFKDKNKQGEYKIIGIKAKRARGLMADYAIANHIENPEELKEFDSEGYQFSKQNSDEDHWVFMR